MLFFEFWGAYLDTCIEKILKYKCRYKCTWLKDLFLFLHTHFPSFFRKNSYCFFFFYFCNIIIRTKEETIFEEILWSDPVPMPGISPTSRGAGIGFGPDVTKAFLTNNNLKMLIRSHEVVSQGFVLVHNHQVITLFSASNYCGLYDNFGAVIAFREDTVPSFITYRADNIQTLPKWANNISLKENVLRSLQVIRT